MSKTLKRSSVAEVVGLPALAYYLPPKTATLDALARAGKLESDKRVLRSFGFNTIHVAAPDSAYALAEKAMERLFRNSEAGATDVDAVLYSSAVPLRAPRGPANAAALFRYPATALQYRFGMHWASVTGISQAGCVSFLSAIRMARDMICGEPLVHRVVCISSDVLPSTTRREVLYNAISDGACAALVERHSRRNRIVAYSQVTKGSHWRSDQEGIEIIASYFPTARSVIFETLEKARLKIPDIRLIIPHNVNRKSWEILLQLIGARKRQFFGRNIARNGHTIAADNIINLHDAIRSGAVRQGDYVLLFTFGFGAHWACMILQH